MLKILIRFHVCSMCFYNLKTCSDDLMVHFGLPPSRRVGEIKRALEAAVEAGEIEPRLESGEYIAFLDADDVWLPNKLQYQIAALEAHPGRALYWRVKLIGPSIAGNDARARPLQW